jgi:membrane-associated protein
MPIIRTLVPMIAGASKLKFKKFLLFNLFGSLVWVCTLVPLGFYVGKTYPGVMNYSIYIILLFIVIATLPMLKIMFSKIIKS